MIAKEEHAQASLVEAIAQDLIDLGYRPATTASYIRHPGDKTMRLVAPETWAIMRELLVTPAVERCE